jgi:hypothetical protein
MVHWPALPNKREKLSRIKEIMPGAGLPQVWLLGPCAREPLETTDRSLRNALAALYIRGVGDAETAPLPSAGWAAGSAFGIEEAEIPAICAIFGHNSEQKSLPQTGCAIITSNG